MSHAQSLKHIAALFLDLYSTPRDLVRPLTPEQVKDAGRLFLDLITTNEAELLIERERQANHELPDYGEIADMFAERYRRENHIDGPLTSEHWSAAANVFLWHAAGCFDTEPEDTLIS